MILYKVVIRDRQQESAFRLLEDQWNLVTAALSVDPESIDELVLGARRFMGREWDKDWLWNLEIKNEMPLSKPDAILDLAAHCLVGHSPKTQQNEAKNSSGESSSDSDSNQTSGRKRSKRNRKLDKEKRKSERLLAPLRAKAGSILVGSDDPNDPAAYLMEYHLSVSWEWVEYHDDWRQELDRKARARAKWQPVWRSLAYELALPLLVSEVWALAGGALPLSEEQPITSRSDWDKDFELQESTRNDPRSLLQAKWMLVPRPELGERSLHSVMVAETDHIEFDLASREEQWQITLEQPWGIKKDSLAFQYSLPGPNEIVIYDLLVFTIISYAWRLVEELATETSLSEVDWEKHNASLVEKVERYRAAWMVQPNPKWLEGLSPEEVLTFERQRIPMTLNNDEQSLDCECPLCQMIIDDGGIAFWHLEDRVIATDYPFSRFPNSFEWMSVQGCQLERPVPVGIASQESSFFESGEELREAGFGDHDGMSLQDSDELASPGNLDIAWLDSQQLLADFAVQGDGNELIKPAPRSPKPTKNSTAQSSKNRRIQETRSAQFEDQQKSTGWEDMAEMERGSETGMIETVIHRAPIGIEPNVYLVLFLLGAELSKFQESLASDKDSADKVAELNKQFRQLHAALKQKPEPSVVEELCCQFEKLVENSAGGEPELMDAGDSVIQAIHAIQEKLFEAEQGSIRRKPK